MALSTSGWPCKQLLLAGSSAQASSFSYLSVAGSKKARFVILKRPATWSIRCHNETQLLETVDRTACPSVKADIDPATFSNVDLRVGLITGAKAVLDPEMSAKRGKPTDSRRHLELTVDIGCETRTVVSECKYVMDVEDAVGKKVLVVANVPPTEILGIKSHGFILTGLNYDPTPMPRSFKVILPGLGRLPPGSQVAEAAVPK
ncbi:hypothetical protein L7F22_069439 [Adiantum nelumboides]|nr:hypothetical protein [Adiantum nelumboides]